MSEQEINSTLPTGSPILAYGTAGTKPRTRLALLIITGILVALLIGAGAYLRTSIRMPQRIIALAAVRAQTELPDGAPGVWVDALHQATTPVIIGIAQTDAGFVPFALTRKGHGAARFVRTDSGPLSLYSESALDASDTWSLSRVLSFASHAIHNPAYLHVDTRTLVADGSLIEGAIDNTWTWHTNARIPTDIAADLPNGDLRLNIRAFPEAWPMIQQELLRSGFDIEPEIAPSAIGWSPTINTLPRIDLRFSSDISSSTIASFAAGAGAHDEIPYRLLDGIVVQEFRLPLNQVASATDGTLEVASGTTLLVSPRRLAIEDGSATSQPENITGCQPGDAVVLNLDAAILQEISDSLRIIPPKISALTISSHNGSVDICLK